MRCEKHSLELLATEGLARRLFTMCRGTRAFSLMELLVVIGIISTLAAVLLPALAGTRAAYQRAGCAANLATIAQAMSTYALQEGRFPTNVSRSANLGKWKSSPGGLEVDDPLDPIQAIYDPSLGSLQYNDPMVNEWLLILQKVVVPKQFLCKGDPRIPAVAQIRYINTAAGRYGTFLNFGMQSSSSTGTTLSYAFAFPWVGTTPAWVADWWKGSVENSRVLGADIGPSLSPPLNDPTATPGTAVSNSKNHGGKGQNVLFSDNHVSFERRNDCGYGNDNIYTGMNNTLYVQTTGTTQAIKGGGGISDVNRDPNDVILAPAAP